MSDATHSGPVAAPRPRGTGTPDRADATRARIIEAAATCLARFGHARLRIEDVAKAAGVTRALIHRYCGDKATLVAAVREHVIAEWSGEVDRATAQAPDAAEAFASWLRVNIQYAARQPLVRAAFSEDALMPGALGQTEISEARGRMHQRVRRLVARGIEEGHFDDELDLDATAAALGDLVVALMSGLVRDNEPRAVSARRRTEAAIRIMLNGLRATPRKRGSSQRQTKSPRAGRKPKNRTT